MADWTFGFFCFRFFTLFRYFGTPEGSVGAGGERGRAAAANRGKGGKRPVTILLVDEMDQLVTRSQSVLYNIFEWPMHRDSCLSVIGIANTIDLPERFLPRVLSRLGLQRVAFQPYSQQQIQCIIRSRLEDLEGCDGGTLFDRQAIEYVITISLSLFQLRSHHPWKSQILGK